MSLPTPIAREAARDAADATAKVAHAAERELDEQTSAFIAWAAAVGADVDDTREARMVLRMNELEESRSGRANKGDDAIEIRPAKTRSECFLPARKSRTHKLT